MARFIEPARLDYISQYVPIPADLLLNKIQTEEKGYETAESALGAYKQGIKPGLRTKDIAEVVNQDIRKRAEAMLPVLESGDWRGAISKLKRENAELQKNPLFRFVTQDYEYAKQAQNLYQDALKKGDLGVQEWFSPVTDKTGRTKGEIKQIKPEEVGNFGEWSEDIYGTVSYSDLPKFIDDTFAKISPYIKEISKDNITDLQLGADGRLYGTDKTTKQTILLEDPKFDPVGKVSSAMNQLRQNLESSETLQGQYFQEARNQGLISPTTYPTTADYVNSFFGKFREYNISQGLDYTPIPTPSDGGGGDGTSKTDAFVTISPLTLPLIKTDGTPQTGTIINNLTNDIGKAKQSLQNQAIEVANRLQIPNEIKQEVLKLSQTDPSAALAITYNALNKTLEAKKATLSTEEYNKLNSEMAVWNRQFENLAISQAKLDWYQSYQDTRNKSLADESKVAKLNTWDTATNPKSYNFLQTDLKVMSEYLGQTALRSGEDKFTRLDLLQAISDYEIIKENGFTNQELIQFYNKNPQLKEAIKLATQEYNKRSNEVVEFNNSSLGPNNLLVRFFSNLEDSYNKDLIDNQSIVKQVPIIYGKGVKEVENFEANVKAILTQDTGFSQLKQNLGYASQTPLNKLFSDIAVSKDPGFNANLTKPSEISEVHLVSESSAGIPMFSVTLEQKGSEGKAGPAATIIIPLTSLVSEDSRRVFNRMVQQTDNYKVQEAGAYGLAWLDIDNTERAQLYNLDNMPLKPGDPAFDVNISMNNNNYKIKKTVTSPGIETYTIHDLNDNLIINQNFENLNGAISQLGFINYLQSQSGGQGGDPMGKPQAGVKIK